MPLRQQSTSAPQLRGRGARSAPPCPMVWRSDSASYPGQPAYAAVSALRPIALDVLVRPVRLAERFPHDVAATVGPVVLERDVRVARQGVHHDDARLVVPDVRRTPGLLCVFERLC